MEANKQLWIMGSVFLIMSSLLFVIGFIFVSETSLLSVAFIAGLILFLGHQGFMWWILYQFAITKKRMSNKLHLLNKVALGGSVGFMSVYLILIPFIHRSISESLNPISTIIIIILMVSIIIYQENNTNNFFTWNLHKRTNQTKKEFNQSIGFVMAWMVINLIWLSIAFYIPLTIFTFMYLFLLVLQSSLTYTTYGQSKYWNFAYEAVLLIQLFVISLHFDVLLLYILSTLFISGFMLRQWVELEYKRTSKIIGIVLYITLSLLLYINPMQLDFLGSDPSNLIGYPLLMSGSVFLILFMVDNPKFYEKIFVK